MRMDTNLALVSLAAACAAGGYSSPADIIPSEPSVAADAPTTAANYPLAAHRHPAFFETSTPMFPEGAALCRRLVAAYAEGLSHAAGLLDARRQAMEAFVERREAEGRAQHKHQLQHRQPRQQRQRHRGGTTASAASGGFRPLGAAAYGAAGDSTIAAARAVEAALAARLARTGKK
jgi:hypothetical protein